MFSSPSAAHGSVAQRRSVSEPQQPEQSHPCSSKAAQVYGRKEPHVAPWHLFRQARGEGGGGRGDAAGGIGGGGGVEAWPQQG